MTIILPDAIAAYFRAENAGDPLAVADCFTHSAVVRDEGRVHEGRAAIQRWKQETTAKYRHTITPLAAFERDGATAISCRLAGTFPGSPIEVQFAFHLEDGKINLLEIGS